MGLLVYVNIWKISDFFFCLQKQEPDFPLTQHHVQEEQNYNFEYLSVVYKYDVLLSGTTRARGCLIRDVSTLHTVTRHIR
jgi:hypothetical protein